MSLISKKSLIEFFLQSLIWLIIKYFLWTSAQMFWIMYLLPYLFRVDNKGSLDKVSRNEWLLSRKECWNISKSDKILITAVKNNEVPGTFEVVLNSLLVANGLPQFKICNVSPLSPSTFFCWLRIFKYSVYLYPIAITPWQTVNGFVRWSLGSTSNN